MSDTTFDHAATIRSLLKTRHRWTSRDVSVRADYYSMGSSIRVVIKNPDVPLDAVKAIAEKAERIDRCTMTGEILGGGNRFVQVSYSSAARDVLTQRYLDTVQRAAIALADAPEGRLIPIDNTPYLLGRGHHGYGFSVWDSITHRCEVMDASGAALWIGQGGCH